MTDGGPSSAGAGVRTLPDVGDFEAWTKLLRKTYFDAKRAASRTGRKSGAERVGSLPPRKQPLNALKGAAYGYLLKLIAADKIHELTIHVVERDGPWKGPPPQAATWVLRLVESEEVWILDPSARNRAAAELTLAADQQIRPEMLLAFLYEMGGIVAIKGTQGSSKPMHWASKYR